MAALAPISTPIGRRCRRGRLASLTRGELALIEWLKLDDRCSVIAAYPERHGARIAAAGWSEGRKLPGRGALCDRHGAEATCSRTVFATVERCPATWSRFVGIGGLGHLAVHRFLLPPTRSQGRS